MTPSELYYFIGKCLCMDDDAMARQSVEAEILSGNVVWEELVWMASNHFVLTALYTAYKRNGILALLPGELADHLSHIYLLNAKRNMQIVEQSHHLIQILNSKGIEPVFLKGAGHLLQGLYPDAGDRIMSDIDILVPAQDIETAAQLLYLHGYFHPEDLKDDDFGEHHHLPGFEHTGFAARVELHHAVFPGKYGKILSTAEIMAGKKKIGDLHAWLLSDEHQMVLNFVHDQLVDDDFMYKTMRIKGLFDYYLMATKNLPQKIKPSVRGYQRKFNTYCAFASNTFNSSPSLTYDPKLVAGRFKGQFVYLLNHPKTYSVYQFIILYYLRISGILYLLGTAPFSPHSRRYIKKKIGSLAAVKKYFQRLKNEL